MTAADELTHHLRRISALERVAGLLDWDQETQMPRRGAAQRAEEAGAVAQALHALAADPRLAELCDAAEAERPAAARSRSDIREARRLHGRATRIDGRLAAALAQATAEATTVWQAARAASRFADFAPALDRVVTLKREEAGQLAADGPHALRRAPRRPRAGADHRRDRGDVRRAAARTGRAARPPRRAAAPAPRPSGRFPAAFAARAVAQDRRRVRLRLGRGPARSRGASVSQRPARRRRASPPGSTSRSVQRIYSPRSTRSATRSTSRASTPTPR